MPNCETRMGSICCCTRSRISILQVLEKQYASHPPQSSNAPRTSKLTMQQGVKRVLKPTVFQDFELKEKTIISHNVAMYVTSIPTHLQADEHDNNTTCLRVAQLPLLPTISDLHPRPPYRPTHLHRRQPPPSRRHQQGNRPLLHPHLRGPPTRLFRPPHKILPDR